MKEYCGLETKPVRFMFERRQVFESDTPDLIGMKQGNNIDAHGRLNSFSSTIF